MLYLLIGGRTWKRLSRWRGMNSDRSCPSSPHISDSVLTQSEDSTGGQKLHSSALGGSLMKGGMESGRREVLWRRGQLFSLPFSVSQSLSFSLWTSQLFSYLHPVHFWVGENWFWMLVSIIVIHVLTDLSICWLIGWLVGLFNCDVNVYFYF